MSTATTISKQLNLVIPLYNEDMKTVFAYAHSMPISEAAFDKYHRPMRAAYAQIWSDGDIRFGGAQTANKVLRDVSKNMPGSAAGTTLWDAPDGVQAGLVNEMYQRTNILCIGQNGWETVTFDQAKKHKRISAQDAEEVDAAVTFFTLVSVLNRRSTAQMILDMCITLWGASTTSLNVTEYRSTLPTSIDAETTGAKIPASLVAC
jgi:hypothetical protein